MDDMSLAIGMCILHAWDAFVTDLHLPLRFHSRAKRLELLYKRVEASDDGQDNDPFGLKRLAREQWNAGMQEIYRPGNTDAERCLCPACQKKKGLKVIDRVIYRIDINEPVGYFDDQGNYTPYGNLPQYEEMQISYPQQ